MFRTFLEVANGQLPDYPLDGYDVMPFFTGEVSHSPQKMYAFLRGGLRALRVGKWKLKVNTGQLEVFNLAVDPDEYYYRAGAKIEIVEYIRKRIDKLAKQLDVKIDTNKQYPSYDPGKYYNPDSYKLYNRDDYYNDKYYT